MMKNYLKSEIKYGFYSKLYYKMFALICILVCGIQFINYSAVMEMKGNYDRKVEFYNGDIEAMQEDLNGEFKVTVSADGKSGMIENPILYYKTMLSQYVSYIHPDNVITQLEEMSLIIIPIVFSLFGAIYVSLDDKYRMKKLKTIRNSKFSYIKMKQISMLVSALMIAVSGVVFGIISNRIFFMLVKNKIDMSLVDISLSKTDLKTEFARLSIILLSIFVFLELGALLAAVFRNSTMSVCIIFAYLYILHIPGKYELLNCINYLYDKFFDFKGIVNVELAYDNFNFAIVLCELILLVLISIVIKFYIETKRSSFEAIN
ncbi:MAG: hypothetical protein E7270_06935 [Lachnospiraceae bacterium]|nr:hypothetical protein [Lachnospiraceae bacterium]MBQ4068720.1 hypothetical protein [Lachnospiraceae bacterium]